MNIEEGRKASVTTALDLKPKFDCVLLYFVRNFCTILKIGLLFFFLFNIFYFANQYYKLLLRVNKLEILSKNLSCFEEKTVMPTQKQNNDDNSEKKVLKC